MTGADATTSPAVAAEYFDGRSARPRRVVLHLAGRELVARFDAVRDTAQDAAVDPAAALTPLRWPLVAVRWPERTRHGARVAHLADGGSLQALDAAAWDRWARAAGLAESPVVRAQQQWRAALVAVLALALAVGVGYRWGVPWLARGVLAVLPASADRAIGEAVLRSMDGSLLQPSRSDAARQQRLREALAQALARRDPATSAIGYTLRFHAAPRLGANALALPGGTIVVTDEMLALLQDRDDVLLGVVGHELGHVRGRHGMRLLVQAALLATAGSVALGDFSSVLAAAPALLGQTAYSRDFERAADAEAVGLLKAAGVSPAVMVELFERLANRHGPSGGATGGDDAGLGIALASHPADAERVRFFRDAAGR